MNTKGIKFLAVLAVLAMAFAAFAVIAPAEENDAAESDATTIISADRDMTDVATGSFYVTANATLTLGNDTGATNPLNIYIKSGVTATVTGTATANKVIFWGADSATDVANPIVTYDNTASISVTTTPAGEYTYNSTTKALSFTGAAAQTTVGGVIYTKVGATNTTYTAYGNDTEVTSELKLEATGDSVVLKEGTIIVSQKASSAGGVYAIAGKLNAVNNDSVNYVTFAFASGVDEAGAVPMSITGTGTPDTDITITAVSGSAKFANGCTGINLNALSAGDKGANASIIYAPGAQTVTTISSVCGDLTAVASSFSHSGAVTFTSFKGTVAITDGAERKIAVASTATAYSGSLNAGALTVTTATTLELVKGAFTHSVAADTDITATLIVDESASIDFNNTSVTPGDNTTIASLTVLGTATKHADSKDIVATKLYVGESAVITGITSGDAEDYSDATYVIQGTLESSTTVANAKLGAALTIPEGMYLEVTDKLFLNNTVIIVEGELRIASNAQITSTSQASSVTTNSIILKSTGKIVNNGTIGKNFAVKVMTTNAAGDAEYSSISALAVKGLDFGVKKSGSNYVMTVGGIVSEQNSTIAAGHTVVLNKVNILNTEVMTGVKIQASTSASTLTGNVELEMNTGSILDLSTTTINVMNGAAITVNGFFYGTITAKTFTGFTAQDVANIGVSTNYTDVTFASYDNDGDAAVASPNDTVSGFTLSVARLEYTDLTLETPTVKYDQRAYISGDLKVASADATLDPVTLRITGTAFIDENDEVTLAYNAAGTAINTNLGNGTVVVLGGLNYYDATGANAAGNTAVTIVGAAYKLKEGNTEKAYVDGYETGLIMLDAASTVKLYGGTDLGYGIGKYTLTDDLEIGKGQSITAGAIPTLIVPLEYAIYVGEGGSLAPAAVYELDGCIVVYSGGSCAGISSSLYQVVSTAEDGTKTYASLAVALLAAEPGTEIAFPGENATTIQNVTVPEGVTLKVTGTLKVSQIVVEKDAKVILTNSGAITMLNYSTSVLASINVKGEMDVTPGTLSVTAPSDKSTVTSTGKFTYPSTQTFGSAKIIGVTYTSEGNIVLTSLATAAENSKTLTIAGKYTTSDTVDLKGKSLTITGEAEVAQVDITGTTGFAVTGEGKFTGTVIGKSGAGLLEETVEVKLTGFNGTITNTSVKNASAEDEYTFTNTTASTKGSIEVVSGTFLIANSMDGADGAKSTFELDDDATLKVGGAAEIVLGQHYGSVSLDGDIIIPEGKALKVSAPLLVPGYMAIEGTFTADTTDEFAEIDGVIDLIAGAATLKNVNLEGALIAGEDLNFSITGNMIVGSPSVGAASPVEGKISLITANTYIIDYTGALTAENFVTGGYAGAVAFLINDFEFMNVFYKGNVAVDTVLGKANFSVLTDIKTTGITEEVNWKYVATGKNLANNANLDAGKDVYFTAQVQTVQIIASWANGTSLYVDNVRIIAQNPTLTVGTHKISAILDPGYKGIMTVTYDGKVVTDTITITADDAGKILALTGDITVDPGEAPEPTPAEKEAFGITEILLVVLIILIAVMVIVVIMRMNRS